MTARFKVGDQVKRIGTDEICTITAVGPRKRLPDEEAWYCLRKPNVPEVHIRPFREALDSQLEAA